MNPVIAVMIVYLGLLVGFALRGIWQHGVDRWFATLGDFMAWNKG